MVLKTNKQGRGREERRKRRREGGMRESKIEEGRKKRKDIKDWKREKEWDI